MKESPKVRVATSRAWVIKRRLARLAAKYEPARVDRLPNAKASAEKRIVDVSTAATRPTTSGMKSALSTSSPRITDETLIFDSRDMLIRSLTSRAQRVRCSELLGVILGPAPDVCRVTANRREPSGCIGPTC
jgi:hypothetical protein